MTAETRITHTPGPWRTHDVRVRGQHEYTQVIRGDATPHQVLANVYSATEDARLIAAAPDLLAALKALLHATNNIEVLGEWEALDINPNQRKKTRAQVDEVITQSRAAIRKATGE
jgi:hypothetical protein